MKANKITFLIFFVFIINLGFSQITITLQPGASEGKDARIHSLGTYTTGDANKYVAKAWTYSGNFGTERSLIEFDLSQIPANAQIISAKLSLYDPNYNDDHHSMLSGSNKAILQRITTDWEENSVTWNNQPSVTSENQVLLNEVSEEHADYTDIDVSDLVQDMINNPNSSFGFMFKLQTEEYYRAMVFASSDHPDLSKHPKLEITYTVETLCLVAYYPFNGNADDESVNVNDGTVYGATLTKDRFGNANAAYSFNGSTDFINCGNDESLQMTNSMSISLWFKSDNSNTSEGEWILAKTFQPYQSYEYGIWIDDLENIVQLKSVVGGSASVQIGTGNIPTENVWHFVAATAEYPGKLKLYYDGFLVNSISTNGPWIPTSADLIIGSIRPDETLPERFFEGSIDDIKIFNCALSAEEINDLYTDTVGLNNDLLTDTVGLENDSFPENYNFNIDIYPNPTYKEIIFKTDYTGNINMSIFDINGKLILKKNYTLIPEKIDVSNLPQGMYFLNFKANNKIVSKKFVKLK